MDLADRITLDEIRKAAGRAVDPATWDAIEAQVEQAGLTGLTGSARSVVEAVVAKHGQHDQSTHGHGGGGSRTTQAPRIGQTVGIRGMGGRWKVTGARHSPSVGETLFTVLGQGRTREVTIDKITDPPTPTTSAGVAGLTSMYGA